MARLSALYDSHDTGYPLFYTGVLTFAITICLPLNLGLSKMSPIAAFAIFAAGFVSLFMLARNPKVGFDLLNHIRIGNKRKASVIVPPIIKHKPSPSPKHKLETIQQDPFPYLQNMIESIVRNDEYEQMDPDTKERLVQILQRLQTVSKDIGKTQKN